MINKMYNVSWAKEPIYYDLFNSTISTFSGMLEADLNIVNTNPSIEPLKNIKITYTSKGKSHTNEIVPFGGYTADIDIPEDERKLASRIFHISTMLHPRTLTTYMETKIDITLTVIEKYEEGGETKERDKTYTFNEFPYMVVFNGQRP